MSTANTFPAPGASSPIGIFDSGLGGLSVLREVALLMPSERIVYFADNQHMPYGPRTLEEVRDFSTVIAAKLMQIPVKAIVVACNTASAASLKHLRKVFPGIPFVGMEPAVKPAAAETRSGKVGVLATQATFHGELFESVVERFAADVEVICQPCPGLAEFIENHSSDHPVLGSLLERFIQPLLDKGVDRIVLACTHYPLVKDAIQRVAGPGVSIVDPSPAIARRTRQVLAETAMLAGQGEGDMEFYASGDAQAFSEAASYILGRPVRVAKNSFRWIPVQNEDFTATWRQRGGRGQG